MASYNNRKKFRINVPEALYAICTHGKGRCWYCDAKLPDAKTAVDQGWDVRRLEAQPVASIILVCPDCAARERRRAPLRGSIAVSA